MSGPIKPGEVADAIRRTIPDEVFEAFNELIAENWCISGATMKQEDVVARIRTKLNTTAAEMHKRGWLNVEEAYREAGWCVEYDKPGYNESYPATFTFKASR
jgi:hypothetical protein